jgi:hypothetical protein
MNIYVPDMMTGHLSVPGLPFVRGGFMAGALPQGGLVPINGGQTPIQRSEGDQPQLLDAETLGLIQRGEADINAVLAQLAGSVADLQRGITSASSNFPVRENLEAPAISLVPDDTPIRNMLPRVPGAGTGSNWRQITTLGGGWGSGYDQPGGGSAIRNFYAETGAPVEHTTTYAAKSAAYKLLGALGSITGFAMAAGANYQDQMAAERQHALTNTMLNEEFSLLWGDSTSTAAPWGDGTNALAFDGLMNLVATANGTPSAQVQTSVGALTLGHIDAQLTRIWNNGGKGLYIIANAQENQSLTNLLQAANSVYRFQVSDQGNATVGFRVTKFIHAVSGETVDIITSRFQVAGSMLFGAQRGPDGKAAADVEVLPQVPVPVAPEKPQQVQGYTLTDLARTISQPDVHPFMISVYEVLRLKNANIFGKSTGVTAVS